MTRQFHISGSRTERPEGEQVIFCDGSADDSFRSDIDIELSHWIPNRTSGPYKADTSTEICMKFAKSPLEGEWDVVINNHVDVDGILSVFTLVDSPFALKHRQTIIGAAEMGDFWAWGEEPAQILFQGLTLLMDELTERGVDAQEVYGRCFERARTLLEGSIQGQSRINAGLAHLQASVERIQSGQIFRKAYTDCFVHYAIPAPFASNEIHKALHVPSFNEALSDRCILWPHARARWDREKVCLVSVETSNGWYYDLWYPGYMWADTPDRWRAPGLQFTGSSNGYYYGHEPLTHVVAELQSHEPAEGEWVIAEKVTPFETIPGRNFPVLASFMSQATEPAISKLPPEEVASRLAQAFL